MWRKYIVNILFAALWAAAVQAAEGDTPSKEEPSAKTAEAAPETPPAGTEDGSTEVGSRQSNQPTSQPANQPASANQPTRWPQRPLAAQLRESLRQARAELQAAPVPNPPTGPDRRFLFRDTTAVGVGDILTVLITEVATASSDSQQDSSKKYGASLQAGTGLFDFIPSAGLGYSGSASTKGAVSKSHNIVATVTVTITEQLPNGNFRVEGSQEILIDGRKQLIRLTGIVRPTDIGPNNTVLSSAVGEAKIEYKGDTPRAKSKHKGLWGTIVNGVQSLLEWLF
jgi:flagellar L-ring protein precursor FlgH